MTPQEDGRSDLNENRDGEKINLIYTSDEETEKEQSEKLCDEAKLQESVWKNLSV